MCIFLSSQLVIWGADVGDLHPRGLTLPWHSCWRALQVAQRGPSHGQAWQLHQRAVSFTLFCQTGILPNQAGTQIHTCSYTEIQCHSGLHQIHGSGALCPLLSGVCTAVIGCYQCPHSQEVLCSQWTMAQFCHGATLRGLIENKVESSAWNTHYSTEKKYAKFVMSRSLVFRQTEQCWRRFSLPPLFSFV